MWRSMKGSAAIGALIVLGCCLGLPASGAAVPQARWGFPLLDALRQGGADANETEIVTTSAPVASSPSPAPVLDERNAMSQAFFPGDVVEVSINGTDVSASAVAANTAQVRNNSDAVTGGGVGDGEGGEILPQEVQTVDGEEVPWKPVLI